MNATVGVDESFVAGGGAAVELGEDEPSPCNNPVVPGELLSNTNRPSSTRPKTSTVIPMILVLPEPRCSRISCCTNTPVDQRKYLQSSDTATRALWGNMIVGVASSRDSLSSTRADQFADPFSVGWCSARPLNVICWQGHGPRFGSAGVNPIDYGLLCVSFVRHNLLRVTAQLQSHWSAGIANIHGRPVFSVLTWRTGYSASNTAHGRQWISQPLFGTVLDQ